MNLGLGSLDVGPVEPGPRSAFLQLGRPFERRQRQRNPGQRALVSFIGALLGLDHLPQMMAALGRVAEDMRVAALELVGNAVHDIVEGKQASFVSHASVKHDLKLQIAEFVS